MRVLLRFIHGLGDSAQSTVVLKHLRRYRPEWEVHVSSLIGKHSCFFGLCQRSWIADTEIPDGHFDKVYDLYWYEANDSYDSSPSTKAERCLREVFGIQPDPELWNYTIHYRAENVNAARTYLASVCGTRSMIGNRFPAVAFHYQGNTSADRKNLNERDAAWIVGRLVEQGLVVVLLDWETPRRSQLPLSEQIVNPGVTHPLWGNIGTGDGEALAALIDQCALCIGVDSGPLHVAAATTTPTIGVWMGHHPIHYICPSSNVFNIVQPYHETLIRGNREVGLRFFTHNYRYRVPQSFLVDVKDTCDMMLRESQDDPLLVRVGSLFVRRDNIGQDNTIVQDVFSDDCYRVDEIPRPAETVVDVGAHIGAFAVKWRARNPNATIICVECCPENLPALHRNVDAFAKVVEGAMTYEKDVALLNAVWPNCVSTGGSIVAPLADVAEYSKGAQKDRGIINGSKREYWADTRPLRTVTLEQVLQEAGLETIDVLKLDCEGSEFSILNNTPSLHRIGRIIGEWHGRDRFCAMVHYRFRGWKFEIIRDGAFGLFRLTNPEYKR